MTFCVIKHTDEYRFVVFKRGRPYWVTDPKRASPFPSAADAQIAMRRYGIPYVHVVAR